MEPKSTLDSRQSKYRFIDFKCDIFIYQLIHNTSTLFTFNNHKLRTKINWLFVEMNGYIWYVLICFRNYDLNHIYYYTYLLWYGFDFESLKIYDMFDDILNW